MKKKILSITLALTLLTGILAACSKPGDGSGSGSPDGSNPGSSLGTPDGPQGETPKTPEEWIKLYSDAINAFGGESVEYNPVVTNQDELDEYLLMLVGLQDVSVDALAMSVSMMNVRAYGIVAAKPSAGSEQAVQDGLQSFIDTQKMNFEHYLADQYDIACAAKLEVLSDGTVLMVMCEDAETVFQNIKDGITGVIPIPSMPESPKADVDEALNQLYTNAINAAGGEDVEYNPVVTNGDELDEYMLMLVGLQDASVDALAMSVSMMNVRAYGIVAAKPSAGSEQAVQDGLQSFIDNQKANFEFYLADQYDIACQAKLEVLSDGTVLMVMCEDAETVFQSIKSAIEGDTF